MNKVLALTILSASMVFAADVDVQKQKMAASELKKTMMGQLKAKLAENPVAAIEFCSKNALVITDAVAKKHNLHIKRVSEKNRNSVNIPDSSDKKAISYFAESIKQNGKVSEFAVIDGKYYEPMITNDMCMVCHGKENAISKPIADKIKQLYPADKATGYGIGELRGVIAVW